MTKLYIFDKDGTLVAPVIKQNGGTRPANTPEEQNLLPNVMDKLNILRANGDLIAIASNQGGVAWGFMSTSEAEALMRDCGEKIGGFHCSRYSPYDPKAAGSAKANARYAIDHESRKPRPGMIHDILNFLEIRNDGRPLHLQTSFTEMEVIFVGDQESDRQAAESAGVKFVWAKEFFGWE